jgi:hypothetical protein
MKMSETEIETYADLWMSIKPYLNPKDRDSACEKFLGVINENVCDLTEVADEWVGFDSSLDKAIRNNYIDHDSFTDYDADENDGE